MSTVVQDLHGGRHALPAGDTRRSNIDSNVDCESDLKKNRLLLLFVKSEKQFCSQKNTATVQLGSCRSARHTRWRCPLLAGTVVAKTRCRLGRSIQSYLKDSAWSRIHQAWGPGLKARSAWRPGPKAWWIRDHAEAWRYDLSSYGQLEMFLSFATKTSNTLWKLGNEQLQNVQLHKEYKQRLHGKSPFSENHSFAMAAKDRFSSVSEEDLAKIKEDSRAESTVKATRCWSSLFLSYIEQKRLKSTSKRAQQPSLLIFWRSSTSRWGDRMALFTRGRPFAEWGRRFIDSSGSPRTHGWTSVFSETTQLSMKPTISSTPNSEFWRREESWRQHAITPPPPICSSDLEKIGTFIKTTLDEPIDGTNLTLAGWFILTFHLGLRGREMQLELRKQDLLFSKNENGKEIVELSTSFAQKNHAGGLSLLSDDVSSGRVQDPVQVAIIRKLVALSNPKVDRIFQRRYPKTFWRSILRRCTSREGYLGQIHDEDQWTGGPFPIVHQAFCSSCVSDGPSKSQYWGPSHCVGHHAQEYFEPGFVRASKWPAEDGDGSSYGRVPWLLFEIRICYQCWSFPKPRSKASISHRCHWNRRARSLHSSIPVCHRPGHFSRLYFSFF